MLITALNFDVYSKKYIFVNKLYKMSQGGQYDSKIQTSFTQIER